MRALGINAFRLADLFVLPSLQENFGLSVAEAMASGCPVVISPEVDLSEEVRSAGAGIVVAVEEGAMAGSIRRLLEDPDLRKQMGEQGRRLINERFVWDKVVLKYLEAYKDVLNKT